MRHISLAWREIFGTSQRHQRAVALGTSPEIQVSDLPDRVQKGSALVVSLESKSFSTCPVVPMPARGPFDDEFQRIWLTLQEHGNNRLRAAAALGISRVALYKKLNKYGIEKKLKTA